ncbi:MAG TPA: hypothetical protein VKU83_10035, partial [Puia sp.]|nr:hypothetical protein [Puia sp.]
MLLFALAIAPGVAICLFIYSMKKIGRASMPYLVICFLLGMAATVPALGLQSLAVDPRLRPWRHSILFFAR